MEIWASVAGYEGLYEVSNLGTVRSLSHRDIYGHNYKGKNLKPKIERNGYARVHLSNGATSKYFLVHRLVAEAFIPRKEGCNVVNHLDNNPQNNVAENLEWTTYKGNMQHATRQGRMHHQPNNLRKAIESRKVCVVAISPDGERRVFNSQREAAKATGASRGHIAAICKKKYGYRSSNGFTFEYAI